jgi:hypothetical protein
MILNNFNITKLSNQVRNQAMIHVSYQVYDSRILYINKVRHQIRNQVWYQIRNQVRDHVGNQVWNQVWNQIEYQLGNQLLNIRGNT